MIQTTDALVKNIHEPPHFHANVFHRNAGALLDELYLGHPEQDKKNSPIFVLFLDTKIQQNNITSRSLMSLFLTTMRAFDYDATDISKK